jgi:sigma-B regulation protein RsbU (phosphoserine phosphatase)
MERNEDIILVIDDDRASRRMLARALDEAGYTCRESSGGIEALEKLRSEIPSLLLLDFHMPGLNGAEVLSRLRADENPAIAQLPAIMLTGDGGEESELLCLEAGANDFVTKPINLPVLRARIDTQLRLESLRRQLQQQNDKLEAWREDSERDLAAARLTQQSLIPQKPPHLPGWEVAAAYRPVIQVGGDIYGWLRMSDRRTLFWMADATGDVCGTRSLERPRRRSRRRTSAAPRGASRKCNRIGEVDGAAVRLTRAFTICRDIHCAAAGRRISPLYRRALWRAEKRERALDAGALADIDRGR